MYMNLEFKMEKVTSAGVGKSSEIAWNFFLHIVLTCFRGGLLILNLTQHFTPWSEYIRSPLLLLLAY